MRETVPREPAQHEMLGLCARVISARDPHQLRLEGVIADETRNTFLLETGKGLRRVPKTGVRLELFPDEATAAEGREGLVVEGAGFMGRPEDRIKRYAPRGKGSRGRGGRPSGGSRRSGGAKGPAKRVGAADAARSAPN